jgi:acetylornithine deacetylase/succinyl-diaminopimelate desuccinylase-like protein
MVQCLSLFVNIPTVSGDPQLHEEVFRGAKFLASLLESVGMQVKLAQNVRTKHPCVLARLEVCPSLPTVAFYGHYDVQPAQELVWPLLPPTSLAMIVRSEVQCATL